MKNMHFQYSILENISMPLQSVKSSLMIRNLHIYEYWLLKPYDACIF